MTQNNFEQNKTYKIWQGPFPGRSKATANELCEKISAEKLKRHSTHWEHA